MRNTKFAAAICAALAVSIMAGCTVSHQASESAQSNNTIQNPSGVATMTTLYRLQLPAGAPGIDWSKVDGVSMSNGHEPVVFSMANLDDGFVASLRKQGTLTFIDSTMTSAKPGERVDIGQGAGGYLSKSDCSSAKGEIAATWPQSSVQLMPGRPSQMWVSFDAGFPLLAMDGRATNCQTTGESELMTRKPFAQKLAVVNSEQAIATSWPEINAAGESSGNILTVMVLRPLPI